MLSAYFEATCSIFNLIRRWVRHADYGTDPQVMIPYSRHKSSNSGLVIRPIFCLLGTGACIFVSCEDLGGTLKARAYRWDGDKKCWHTTVTGDDAIKAEVAWLKSNVYGGKSAKVEIEVQNCLSRFSNRPGNRAIREI